MSREFLWTNLVFVLGALARPGMPPPTLHGSSLSNHEVMDRAGAVPQRDHSGTCTWIPSIRE